MGKSLSLLVANQQYHVFNCGVIMGTLVLRNPQNALAAFALSQVDSAIQLYTAVVQSGSSTRLVKNLQWLLRLRSRAWSRISRVPNNPNGDQNQLVSSEHSDDEDIELIGWRTRLIQRAGKGLQKATIVSQTTPTHTDPQATPSPNAAVNKTISLALQQHFGLGSERPIAQDQQSSTSSNPLDNATDQLLHQFWDPMMLQDIPETSSWNDPVSLS